MSNLELTLYYAGIVLAAFVVGWLNVISRRRAANYKKLREMIAEPFAPAEGKVIAGDSGDLTWLGAKVEFGLSHLRLIDLQGAQHVINLGRTVQINVIRTEEVPLGVVLEVSDGAVKVEVLYLAEGLGEFLGHSRRAGSKVAFSSIIEMTFGPQIRTIIEAQLKQPAGVEPVPSANSVVEVVCSGCGAKSVSDQAAPPKACDYCGTIKAKCY